MKERIQAIIESKPKHYSRLVQSDPELKQWVLENSLVVSSNFAEMIYSAISMEPSACVNGNAKKFSGISKGYSFCGPATTCACCKESVATKVSAAKANMTLVEVSAANAKREQTSMQKYGVPNNGQTELAKANHVAYYSSPENVELAVSKQSETINAKYGVSNAALVPGVSEKKVATNRARYGTDNPMQVPEISSKSANAKRVNFDPEKITENFAGFKKLLADAFHVEPLMRQSEYRGVAVRPLVQFRCMSCAYEFEKRFDYGSPPICKVCHPTFKTFKSGEENQVLEFIKGIYNGKIVQSDRSTINPYELDILLVDAKIAIEYCGLYWHSELSGGKKWNYHATKQRLAAAKGIRLITVFSDEWNTKQDIVKSSLSTIIGSTKTTRRMGARKCSVGIVPRVDAKMFHDKYHIQGSTQRLGLNVGLRDSTGELVALGTFNKVVGTSFELVRFSSSKGVTGAASKIIAYFQAASGCTELISFADKRWSEGKMYRSLGFEEVSTVPPVQHYVSSGYSKREHKLKFSRSKIDPTNSGKTEWAIMQELGYDRIWDCGKIKFVKTFIN